MVRKPGAGGYARIICMGLSTTRTTFDISPMAATRDSWNRNPLPEARTSLGFEASYTAEEFDRIKQGLIPQVMEDKWFVFHEESWLYFHRSWTGICIYGVRFQADAAGATVVESWVSGDSSAYHASPVDYERALLTFLIDALLLGKHAAFPLPSDDEGSALPGLYQHHVVGRAYPEQAFRAELSAAPSFWERFRQWMRGDE